MARSLLLSWLDRMGEGVEENSEWGKEKRNGKWGGQ